MTFPEARDPELDSVVLEIKGTGLRLDTFTDYHFTSHFINPTDTFSFTIADEQITDELIAALEIGAEVDLKINGAPQCSGYIWSVEISNDRGGGTSLHIEGRDKLSPVVDGHMDPRLQFKEGMSLGQVLATIFASYGFRIITTSNEVNRNVITGKLPPTKTKVSVVEEIDVYNVIVGALSGGLFWAKQTPRRVSLVDVLTETPGTGQFKGAAKTKRGRALKKFTIDGLKPSKGEGAFAFASRISQRFGLWIWLDATGETIIVGEPDFAQAPRGRLQRRIGEQRGVENNILSGGAKRDAADQPNVIFGWAKGGNAGFEKATLRQAIINPFISSPNLGEYLERYPDIKTPLGGVDADLAFTSKFARPMYLEDTEAQTLEQLEAFLRREMSLHARKALTAHYTVAGHVHNGQVWSVDTVVDVDDEISKVREPMWIIGRQFSKSRSSGTSTTLELIRLNSIEF